MSAPLTDVDEEQRQRARAMYRQALKDGRLVKPDSCQTCGGQGRQGIHGHHHNGYSDEHALDVQWLCASCHAKVHGSFAAPPEERAAIGRGRLSRLTAESRTEIGRKAALATNARWTRTPESAAAHARKMNAGRSFESRSASSRRSWERLSTEERAAAARKGWETRRARAAAAAAAGER